MSDINYLTNDDQEFLKRKGWKVSVARVPLEKGHEIDIVVHDYPLPAKYHPQLVDLLVRQLPGYPTVGMDMFWTSPIVVLKDSNAKPPATETVEKHLGRDWQMWSRHMNIWRPEDNLETFFAAIAKELSR
jgi:hypothetical protein